MVAPLSIARGTQNKILEAMAVGVPVVTSSVAAGGVDAVAGEHFLVADSRRGHGGGGPRADDRRAAARRIRQGRRARMLSHHAWDKSMQRLDGIIERCVAGRARRDATRATTAQQQETIA